MDKNMETESFMLFKRFTAFVLSSALILGVMPAVVFAKEIDFEADDTEVSETSEEQTTETEPKEKKKAESDGDKNTKAGSDKTPEQGEDKKPEATEKQAPDTKDEKESEPGEETKPETKEETVTEPSEEPVPETKETETETSKETETVEAPAVTDKREPDAGANEVPETDKEKESKEEPKTPDVIKGKLPAITSKDTGPSDNDSLFGKYLEGKFYKKPARRGAKSIPSRGSELKGLDAVIYNAIVPKIKAVAEGTETSTEFYFPVGISDLADKWWTADEIGVSVIVENGNITDETYKAMSKKFKSLYPFDLNAINLSLLADLPYELYWYDKTTGVNLYLPSVEAVDNNDGKGYVIHFVDDTFDTDFTVAEAYSAGNYKTDPTKINKANTAISNVDSIIETAKIKSDYEKMDYYREWICNAVYYDFAPIIHDYPYGDPWQLVSVFDNDPDTNVVCEGYSKAFKYLCDRTDFAADISCITVTGDMDGEGHMWNIVRMSDGKYYHVDITNCDSGSIGYPDKLFFKTYTTGVAGKWYSFKFPYDTVKYVYDDETLKIYSAELRICNQDYLTHCGDNLWWRVDGSNLIVTGSGNMFDWNSPDKVVWSGCKGKTKSVSLPDALTSISDYAFSGFTGITSVTIPSAVTSIGKEAFKGCTGLKTVYMDEKLKPNVDPTAFDDCPNVVIQYYNTVGDYEYIITNPAVDGTGTVMLFGMATKKETVAIPAAVDIDGVIYKVTRIHGKAFYKNTTVKTVFIGPNVKSIDSYAFYGCSKLVKVNGGSGILTVGSSAFRACAKLKTFSISSTKLKKIGVFAFSGDKALKTVQIKRTARLTKSGVKKSLKGSSVKTVKVKKSKLRKYRKYFKKSNSGRKVKVRK